MTATYILSKIDNKTYCKTNGHFTRYLKMHNLTYKDYFEIYETKFSPLCYCLQPLTFYQKTETYANSCGRPKCVGKSVSNTKQNWTDNQKLSDKTAKKEAAKLKTNEQKLLQKEKASATFLKKYGVAWSSKSDIQKEKSRKTKLERYGNETYSNHIQANNTRINKTIEEKNLINEKRRITNIKKYGVSNVLLSDLTNLKKSAKSNSVGKDFILPNGEIVGIRGYEGIALNTLFEQTYTIDDIIFHNTKRKVDPNLPVFEYTDTRRHRLRYYPDIYIPSENRIIEVKSQWWWNGNGAEKYKSRSINNLRKRDAVIKKGYKYEVWLYTNKYTYRILTQDADFSNEN